MTRPPGRRSVGCMNDMQHTRGQPARIARSSWSAPAPPASCWPRTCWPGASDAHHRQGRRGEPRDPGDRDPRPRAGSPRPHGPGRALRRSRPDRALVPLLLAEAGCRLSLDLARYGTRFGFMLDIPQHQTESLLRARVAELGGVIEQGAELTGLADGAAGVTARVRDARRPDARDHRRLRGRLRRRAQPGPPRAWPALPRSPVPAGLAAGRRPAGLGPPGERGACLLPGRRRCR